MLEHANICPCIVEDRMSPRHVHLLENTLKPYLANRNNWTLGNPDTCSCIVGVRMSPGDVHLLANTSLTYLRIVQTKPFEILGCEINKGAHLLLDFIGECVYVSIVGCWLRVSG